MEPDQKTLKLQSDFVEKSRISGVRATRKRILARQEAELADLDQLEAVEAECLLASAPDEVRLFLKVTQIIPELFKTEECMIDDIDGATFAEYGFFSKEDAVAKLQSLGEAWKKEVRVDVSPDGYHGVKVAFKGIP